MTNPPGDPLRKGRRWNWKLSRDSILLVLGAFGFVWQVVIDHTDRPTLLLVCAGLMGLPVFLRTDERHRDDPP